MRTVLRAVAITVSLISCTANSAESTMITKESLIEMFENILNNTEWNVSNPLLWGISLQIQQKKIFKTPYLP